MRRGVLGWGLGGLARSVRMSLSADRVMAVVRGWVRERGMVAARGVGVLVSVIVAAAMGAPVMAQEGFGNNTPIIVPSGAPGVTVGVASPYPSPIVVTGLKRPIAHVT